MPRFAANLSMLFTEVPLVARFARAKAAGFDAVEIQFPFDVPKAELADALAASDLALALFNVPAPDLLAGGDGLACVPGREAAFRDAVGTALDYAATLRPKCLNVLAGRVPEGVARARCEETFAANLAFAADAIARAGFVPVVEALNPVDVPRFLLPTLADVLAAIDRSGSCALAQYDVYHAATMGADVVTDLRTHAARIGHVQVADLPGRTAPGTGTLDFATIFATLDALFGASAFVGAEYRPNGPTEPTLAFLSRA